MKNLKKKFLSSDAEHNHVADIDLITKTIESIYDTYGVYLEYSITPVKSGFELKVAAKNWQHELATYKGASLSECIQLFQIDLNHNQASNSNLRRYLEKLPIFGELKELFSTNDLAKDFIMDKSFPKNLVSKQLKTHAEIIEDIYEPNLLIQLLVRVAKELDAIKNSDNKKIL